jgi:hypothetical protein
MTRRTADLFRAEDRIAELEAENETLRGILRRLHAQGVLYRSLSDPPYLTDGSDGYTGEVYLTPTEAALFDQIINPKENAE